MGCLSVTVTRVGDFDASVSPASGISVSAEVKGGMVAEMALSGGLDAVLLRVRDFSAGMEQVCSVPFVPYLEIEPEIIWVTPWGTNDVFSNTHWNVD